MVVQLETNERLKILEKLLKELIGVAVKLKPSLKLIIETCNSKLNKNWEQNISSLNKDNAKHN